MTVLTAVLWFSAGMAIEVLNAFTRRWTVERLGRGAGIGWVTGGLILRLAATSTVLFFGFRHHVISGVAALIGYLCSRWVMVLWLHRRLGRGEGREEPLI